MLVIVSIPCVCFSQAMRDTSSPNQLNEVEIYANGKGMADTGNIQQATDELLKRISGVDLIRRGNFAPEPVFHGMNGGDVNITIDGMKIFGACTDKMDPVNSYIEPNNLQSISTSFSSSDGVAGNGIGGNIDFKLKQLVTNADKKWSGLAGGSYQTNGSAPQFLGELQYSLPRFAILFNALYRSSNDYTAGNGNIISYSQYHKWNGNISAKYQLNNRNSISMNYIRDQAYDIGYPALLMDVKFAKADIASFAWNYHNDDGKLEELETKFYINNISHAMDDSHRPASQIPVHMDMPGNSGTLGFNTNLHFRLNANQTLKANVDVYQNKLHAEMTMYPENASPVFMLTIPDATCTASELNLSDKINIGRKWIVTIASSIQYNNTGITSQIGRQQMSSIYNGDLNRSQITWGISTEAKYYFSPNFYLTLNINRGERSATLQEYYSVYIFHQADGYDYIGNPSLKKEASYNCMAGANYSNKRISFQASLYNYYIQHYIAGALENNIAPMTNGAFGVKKYVNLSFANIDGGSIIFIWEINKILKFTSKNDFTYGTDENGHALALIPPFQSNNAVNFIFNKWKSSVQSISSAAQHHVSSFYGESASPAFSLLNVDFSKSFSFKNKELICSFSISNLLNTNYYEHLDVSQIPRPGRSFITTVTFLF